MLKQGKIRQRAFSLKFFSLQTKLILSLVFVFIIAIAFGYNYFQPAKADTLLYSETFLTAVKKDAVATTGKWDTIAPGQARLLGKGWVNIFETHADLEIIDSGIYYLEDIEYDSEGNPYIVGRDNSSGILLPFFVKWTPTAPPAVCGDGITGCWTNMAGTSKGSEILLDTGFYMYTIQLALDNANSPYIIWGQNTSATESSIFFVKWTLGMEWTNMAGNLPGPEELVQNGYLYNYVADIKIEPISAYPQVLYSLSSTGLNTHDLFFSKWNGSIWTKANGIDAGSDNLSNTSADDDQNAVLDFVAGNPYVAWYSLLNNDVAFTKWTPGSLLCPDPVGCWTNIKEDIAGPEIIDQPNPSNNYFFNGKENFRIGIDNNVYISWRGQIDIFIRKGISGAGWSKLDGTAGYTNVSNSPALSSDQSVFLLDSSNNPYFVWRENTGTNSEVYFTRWNGLIWTKMDGTTPPDYDNVSNSPTIASEFPLVALDSSENPIVTYYENGLGTRLKKWNGSVWKSMDGTTDYDSFEIPAYNVYLDIINDRPQLILRDDFITDYDYYFTKWLPDYKTSGTIQSINVNSGSDFISSATISASEGLDGSIAYSLSNDGGATWESATKNTLHTFISEGSDLRWKADLTGTTTVTPAIDSLDISYETKKIYCSIDAVSLTQGTQQTIRATLSFTPPDPSTDVWATIEKDGVLLNTVIMSNTSGNNYVGTYTTTITNLGVNDVVVLASDGTTNYACNVSLGDHWQKMTLSSMPWHRRSGHEVLSYGGYIWMFGGSADNFENDVWRSSDGETWELITADAAWPGRYEFGSAVLNGKMWIFGGRARNAGNTATIFYNDVWWSINGKDWYSVSNAGWTARAMFATSINDNKIWISGGYGGSTVQNQLWYTSDPAAGWTQVSMSPNFDPIAIHQMVTYDDNNDGISELWILGGYNFSLPYTKRDVWKANNIGATAWTHLQFCQGGTEIGKVCTVVGDCPGSTCAYNAPWGARNDFSALVYDLPDTPDLGNKILVMGGANDSNAMLNDVWSYEPTYGWQNIIDPTADGYPVHYDYDSQPSSWTNWSGRFRFRTISYNSGSGNKIYLTGGQEYPVRYWNDVWTTTNAADWELIGDQYDGIFSGRWASSMSAFDAGSGEKLWISGGNNRNDLWSSGDGTTWVKVLSDGNTDYWSQRWMHKTFVFDDKLWLIGGCGAGAGGNGIQCGGRCSGSGPDGVNRKACVKGLDCGADSTCVSAGLNDVWYTDNASNGLTWTQVTANANFAGRYGFSIAVSDDKMWILGGDVSGKCSGGTYSGEICRVDGDCPGSVGSFCSKVCVAGSSIGTTCSNDSTCGGSSGNCSFLNLNDALYSTDGINWTLATASAGWSTRFGHNSIFYDNKLWAMGGWHATDAYNNGTFKNDVWYSADNGASWTLAAANPAWNGRHNFSLVEHRGKMYVYAGNNGFFGNGTGRMDSNNVWSSTDGMTWNQLTGWAEWDGRDFLSYAVFNDRLWLMGGDTMQGNSNEVWASSYDYTDLSFTVSPLPSPGGNPAPDAPGNVVPPCQAVDVTENNTIVKAISWNFHDNATNETGFRLYEVGSGSEILKLEVATPDINVIQEKTNLTANQSYTRTVKAYNSNGTSAGTAPATCYTLANVPNKVKITNITADSVTISLDANDGNPAQTLYAIRVITGTITSFVNPDGSFSPTEAWHTYAEFGGIGGIVMTGLTPGQNYSFSAKAKNGDTLAIETAYSDISNSIPQPETGPNISATKGVAVNLAWNSGFGLFSTAWAGDNFVIDISGTLPRVLGVLAWLLNVILLILLVILGISLLKTLKNLKHKFKYPDTFKLIWSILSKEAHHTYNQHAPQTQEGVYYSSAYHQHKKLHNLSQNSFLGATAVVGLKLMILGALLSGLVSLNHSSLAATPPYDQSGTQVKAGDTLTYIVEVTNNGTASAQDIVISDTLSGYLTYESGTGGINFDSNTNTITYSISSLGINENASMTFKAKVIAGSEEKLITNTANVSGGNFTSIASNPTSNEVGAAIPINENINQPIINENINQPPINENINQPPINENTNQPPTNENINQSPANGNTNQPPGSGTTESQVPIIGPIIDSINEIFDYIGQLAPVKFINEVVFDNPKVEQNSQNVVTPLIITIAIVNTLPAVLVITTYLLPYLHLIFLEPLLFLFGKKRKKWGVVYNSLTKKPVDLALVRLYNKETNQLVQTKVTDREGRYIIIAKEPGKYYLSVTKPGFIIPSSYLRGETQDTKYIDLYHGEVIEVTEKDAVITANIPLDPAEKKSLAFAEIIRSYLLKNLRLIVSYVGLILSLIIVLIIPTAITIGALIIHVLLFLFFRRFLVPAKPKSWGIVYDAKTKEPLGSSVVRIFDMKFNKLLETQVTDSKGRYSFLVGQNQYQMLAEKPGYQNKEVKPVDLVKKEEIVNLDVGLNKI